MGGGLDKPRIAVRFSGAGAWESKSKTLPEEPIPDVVQDTPGDVRCHVLIPKYTNDA